MRLSYLLVLGLVAVCLVTVVRSQGQPEQPVEPQSGRSGFKLPKLFDFERFKSLFRKSYGSLVEELVRQKIFLARAFQAFVSAISYKNRKSSSYLSVNQMSDWTRADIERSMVSADQMGAIEELMGEPVAESISSSPGGPVEPASDDQVPSASVHEIEDKLREIEQHRDEPGYRELADGLEALHRRKRDLSSSSSRHERSLRVDDLMRSPEQPEAPEVQRKIAREGVPTNNPDYEPPELASFGLDDDRQQKQREAIETARNFFTQMLNNPATNFLGNVLQGALKGKKDEEEALKAEQERRLREQRARYVLPEIDHRDSNCFFQPRGQGSCGSCYAFTAMSLYEWLYCKRTGQLVAFSEQFMVDCGSRAGLNGCQGGNLVRTAKFVDEFGLELRKSYPYREKEDVCPYDNSTEPTRMGYLKLDEPGFQLVKIDWVHRFLVKAPMMVGILLSENFRQYGGGIDENPDCRPDDAHAMLLVGSGKEDGREYYLMRNSHKVSWGEAGYWKLAKERFYECSLYSFAVMVTASMGKKYTLDRKRLDYLDGPIRARYSDYVKTSLAKP